jgi:hypothetical protein
MSKTSENKATERIDIESMEARMRLWAIGDVSDEDLALELDYIVPELKRCYEREDMIIRALKDAWIGNTCWHQPSQHLEDIAETRGSILGYIASLLQVDVNRQDIHDLEYGCGSENCEHNASE